MAGLLAGSVGNLLINHLPSRNVLCNLWLEELQQSWPPPAPGDAGEQTLGSPAAVIERWQLCSSLSQHNVPRYWLCSREKQRRWWGASAGDGEKEKHRPNLTNLANPLLCLGGFPSQLVVGLASGS